MPDTLWEETQQRPPRSFPWIRILIFLLGVSLVGIIIYNNRDCIPGFSTSGNERVSGGPASREVFSAGAASQELPEGSGNKMYAGRTAQPEDGLPPKRGQRSRLLAEDSVEIKDIECPLMDRKDILLKLSIRFFFTDPEERSEVPEQRETIAVIVRKTLQTMDLEAVKIDKIKPIVLKEINAAFEKKIFNDIKIDTITVEKVLNE